MSVQVSPDAFWEELSLNEVPLFLLALEHGQPHQNMPEKAGERYFRVFAHFYTFSSQLEYAFVNALDFC